MERNGKNYTKANVEYLDFKDFAKLLIKKGHADMALRMALSELQEKFKSSGEIKFDPINGIRRIAENVVSKVNARDKSKKEVDNYGITNRDKSDNEERDF